VKVGKNTSRCAAAAACDVLASPDGAKTPQAHAAVANEVGFRAATAAGRESFEFSVQGGTVNRETGRLADFIG